MAGLDDILKMLPVDQIAAQLGVDPKVAAQAIQEGGGAILGGLQQNAATPEGASAIDAALGKHRGLGDAVDLDRVDTADGEKILGHIFGDRQQQVAQKLTNEPQTAGIDFGQLLPMLAPVVMGLLAKDKQQAAPRDAAGGGFDVGGLIGGLLGGSGQGSQAYGGLDIGGLLGGLFGGKK